MVDTLGSIQEGALATKCTSLERQFTPVISKLQDAVGWEATKVYLSSSLTVSDAPCRAIERNV